MQLLFMCKFTIICKSKYANLSIVKMYTWMEMYHAFVVFRWKRKII